MKSSQRNDQIKWEKKTHTPRNTIQPCCSWLNHPKKKTNKKIKRLKKEIKIRIKIKRKCKIKINLERKYILIIKLKEKDYFQRPFPQCYFNFLKEIIFLFLFLSFFRCFQMICSFIFLFSFYRHLLILFLLRIIFYRLFSFAF